MSDTLIMLSHVGDRFCVDVVEPSLPPYHLFYGNLRELADVLEEANARGLSSDSCCRAFHLATVHTVGRLAASLSDERILRECFDDEPTPRELDRQPWTPPAATFSSRSWVWLAFVGAALVWMLWRAVS